MTDYLLRPDLDNDYDRDEDTPDNIKNVVSHYASSKVKVSNPSQSLDELNIPEIKSPVAEFVYNFYTPDERINSKYKITKKPQNSGELFEKSSPSTDLLPLSKIPRYVFLRWTSPSLSDFEQSKSDLESKNNVNEFSIQTNASKVVSEDNFFNPHYITFTFSDIDAIEQGATDIEIYSRVSRHDTESIHGMAKSQIKDIALAADPDDSVYERQLGELASSYTQLADLPKSILGLRVYDNSNNNTDDDDLLRTIAKSLTLSMKLSNTIIPDIFEDSRAKMNSTTHKALNDSHAGSLGGGVKSVEGLNISPVKNDATETASSYLTQPIKYIGYIIDRFLVKSDGFMKDATFFIEDISQTSFDDRQVLYGVTYIYSIRVVAAVKMLTYSPDDRIDVSTVYVASRPVSIPIECYEYAPPPEPNSLKFVFDYVDRNLTVFWDMPVNSQRDVKQFQVMRRKSINEPFELIAQYGFDKTLLGQSDARFKTGEVVDANNFDNMADDLKYLVRKSDAPVFMHKDEDFTVDAELNFSSAATEYYYSSDYIYAICSVDAHGMISNYSAQYRVTFDVIRNKLVTQLVCDAGSPRQYPNMNLRLDAFKDVIKVEGDNARQMTVYFTPEYLKIRDGATGKTYNVVEAQTKDSVDSFYVMQMINLDSQKSQTLRINIKDPQSITLETPPRVIVPTVIK